MHEFMDGKFRSAALDNCEPGFDQRLAQALDGSRFLVQEENTPTRC